MSEESTPEPEAALPWLPIYERWWRSYIDAQLRELGEDSLTFREYEACQRGAVAGWQAAVEWMDDPELFQSRLRT